MRRASAAGHAQADYELQAEEEVYLINKCAAEIAKAACAEYTAKDPSKPRFVCGAIGPTNRTLSVSPSVENPVTCTDDTGTFNCSAVVCANCAARAAACGSLAISSSEIQQSARASVDPSDSR